VQTFALTATLDNAAAGHFGKNTIVFLKLISAEMSMDIFIKGQISRANYMCPIYHRRWQRKLTGYIQKNGKYF
jgi:hypothetical protein